MGRYLPDLFEWLSIRCQVFILNLCSEHVTQKIFEQNITLNFSVPDKLQ